MSDLMSVIIELKKQLEEKQKLLDEALKVIEFYGKENMWLGVSDGHSFGSIKWIRIVEDDMDSNNLGGKKAREFLQRMESER